MSDSSYLHLFTVPYWRFINFGDVILHDSSLSLYPCISICPFEYVVSSYRLCFGRERSLLVSSALGVLDELAGMSIGRWSLLLHSLVICNLGDHSSSEVGSEVLLAGLQGWVGLIAGFYVQVGLLGSLVRGAGGNFPQLGKATSYALQTPLVRQIHRL